MIGQTAALVLACTVFLAAGASAGDIKVMTSGAFTAPYLQLSPQFERDAKEKVVTLTTTMGVGADAIPNRIARGEAVDVIIVASASLDELIRAGRVVAGSKVDLAKSDIGMAVRSGAPKPDIRSLEGFTRALLHAKSIAYSASVSGDYLVTELVQRLGIAAQVLGKSRKVVGERVGAVVARGEAEIGFQQISELLPVPGIDYVGPLPTEVQRTTVFSAGVAVDAENPAAARAFIQFLASPGSAAAIRKAGLQPTAAATAEENLKTRNITLPPPATPAGNYVRAVRVGNLLFMASSGPAQDKARGKVGKEVTREEAYQAARTTGLNLLAATRAELGSLDQVRRVVKVAGFVNAAPGFTELPAVLNGFSDLMVEVFGESIGKHARSVVGVAELPNNLPVSVEMILEVAPASGLSPGDIAGIRATSDRWAAAARAGRWEDVAATFTEDAILRFPDAVYDGRAAILKHFQTLKPFDPTRILHIDEIGGRDDLAFVMGHSTVVPAGGGSPVVVGRYMDIRVRQADGTWLFHRDVVTPVPLPSQR